MMHSDPLSIEILSEGCRVERATAVALRLVLNGRDERGQERVIGTRGDPACTS